LTGALKGESVYALRSHMSALDYVMEPPIACPDTDANDVAFVGATSMIRGRNTVEEFLAYGMHPVSANFGFKEIVDGGTPMSKLVVPFLDFHTTRAEGRATPNFWQRWNWKWRTSWGDTVVQSTIPASSRCPTAAT
jgi:hypothetical protein